MDWSERDTAVRLEAFRWLQAQQDLHGEVLPHGVLKEGFAFEGRRVPLLGPQGIFKPAVMPELPLSITTAPHGPYDDSFTNAGFLAYRYRGTDPTHRDNVGLRKAMRQQTPLIYLHGVMSGKYLAVWPVFVVGDDPASLTFTVAADDTGTAEVAARESGSRRAGAGRGLLGDTDESAGRRAYITSTVRRRLHQQGFRERVLAAYRDQCALCRLRHRDLLDAAHIVPDRDPRGDPVVTNGISLCKIHHAAYDHFYLGVRPDYVIEVQPRILRESDGPMLKHGLQGLHHTRLHLPRARQMRPDPQRLAERYKMFLTVA